MNKEEAIKKIETLEKKLGIARLALRQITLKKDHVIIAENALSFICEETKCESDLLKHNEEL